MHAGHLVHNPRRLLTLCDRLGVVQEHWDDCPRVRACVCAGRMRMEREGINLFGSMEMSTSVAM